MISLVKTIIRNFSANRRDVMKVIAGLGNPGKQYQGTRHNAGFMVIDKLCERYMLGDSKTKFHATTTESRICNQQALLMKPMTFMNRSGLAIGEAVRFYKLDSSDVMVIVDDAALPMGHVRLRKQGSSGGHNGLADIQRVLGTQNYPRLRIGVGEPVVGEYRVALRDHVLGAFGDEQLVEVERSLGRACDVIERWLTDGIDSAMTQYNTKATENDQQEAE